MLQLQNLGLYSMMDQTVPQLQSLICIVCQATALAEAAWRLQPCGMEFTAHPEQGCYNELEDAAICSEPLRYWLDLISDLRLAGLQIASTNHQTWSTTFPQRLTMLV